MDLMHSLVPHAALPDYRFRGMHLKMSAVHVPSDISGVMIPEWSVGVGDCRGWFFTLGVVVLYI